MSKLLPAVFRLTLPLDGAVQVHHTDLPPALPATVGSPDCLVAFTLVPFKLNDVPATTEAFANASFTGVVVLTVSTTEVADVPPGVLTPAVSVATA